MEKINKLSWAIAQSNMKLKGFDVKTGHILFIEPETTSVVAVSTGWTCNNMLSIYELREDGVYSVQTPEGTTQLYSWFHEDEESSYPVSEVLDYLYIPEEECEDDEDFEFENEDEIFDEEIED